MDQYTPGENEIPRRNRRGRRTVRKVNWKRFGMSITLILFILFGAVGCGMMFAWGSGMPKFDPSGLEGAMSSTLYDKDGKAFTTLHAGENRIPVELKEVPKDLQQAVLAAEDIRFYDHFGISIPDILRAIWANITGGFGSQGASTITQQLVKLSFLTPEKTLKRKFQEMILTFQVERQYTKDEILEFYLNKIYYGQGATGIKMASITYFGKEKLDDLTLGEKAILAGLPNWPSRWDPIKNPEEAEKRKDMVLDNMIKYGFITKEAGEKAKAEPLKVKPGKAKTGTKEGFPYFADYVVDQAIEKYGLTEAQLYKGGLHIYTTVDSKIQAAAEAAMADPKNFPASKQDQMIQGAIAVLDTTNGQVRAIVGGREHTALRGFNRATDLKRQPGSTFKPIAVYGPAIENGYGPGTVQDDVPTSWGSYAPDNYDGQYRGLITMREAAKFSVNIWAVKMLNTVGIKEGYEFAQKLGIKNLDPKNDMVLGFGLGGLTKGTNPLDMAAAYAAFGNRGVYNEPVVITRITDKNGTPLIDLTSNKPKSTPVMKETTAYLVTDILKSVITEGTGTNAQIGRPAAGKTGTTELPPSFGGIKGNKDAWFAGYTPQYTAVVWIGYDETDRNHYMQKIYGGGYPAQIWRQVMAKAHEGLPVKDFVQPAGIVSVVIDAKSGLLPSPLTPEKYRISELFAADSVPKETSNIWVQAEICQDTGKLATPDCTNRITGVFFKRPVPYTGDKVINDADEELPTGASAAVPSGGASGSANGAPAVAPPGNVKATVRNPAGSPNPSVVLTWSGAGQYYRIYRSLTADFTPATSNRLAEGVTNPSYEDKTVEPNKTYYYKIIAVDANNNVSSPSLVSATVPASPQ